VKVSATERYDADPTTVAEMLADPAFQERKCAEMGALEWEVDVARGSDGSLTVTTSRTMPTSQVPDFVRTMVGETLQITQVDDWGPPAADGSREGSVSVRIEHAPVRLTGTQRIAADGSACVHDVTGDLTASVPLFGGKIEKASEPAIQAAFRKEGKVGRAWLAGR
jgi:hypothetical protein